MPIQLSEENVRKRVPFGNKCGVSQTGMWSGLSRVLGETAMLLAKNPCHWCHNLLCSRKMLTGQLRHHAYMLCQITPKLLWYTGVTIYKVKVYMHDDILKKNHMSLSSIHQSRMNNVTNENIDADIHRCDPPYPTYIWVVSWWIT